MKYHFSILFFFIGIYFNAYTQSNPDNIIDSLLLQLKTARYDTAKINLWNELAYQYGQTDLKTSLAYASKALALSEKIKWETGIAISARYKGNCYLEMGDRKNALPLFTLSVKKSEAINDIEGIVLGYYNLGNIYQHEGKFVEAGENYFKGMKVAEKHQQEGLTAQGNYYASVLFANQNDYKKSNDYATKALITAKKLKDLLYEGLLLEVIGYNYIKQQERPKAITTFQEAIKVYEATHNSLGKAKMYAQLVECYPEEPARQLYYLDISDSIWNSIGSTNAINAVNNIANRGLIYYSLLTNPGKKPDSLKLTTAELMILSEKYLKKGIELCEQQGYRDVLIQHYKSYAEILAGNNDYKGALTNYKKYDELKDSVFSQENKKKIAAIESQRKIEAKDQQIRINELALTNERRTRWALISVTGLLLVIGVLLFYQSRTRRKTNTTLMILNNELDEANKVKTKFFGILSHDLRSPVSQLISFLHLQKEAPELFNKEETLKHQQKLTDTAENLLENMENLLLWSKSQMEQFAPQKKQVEAAALFTYIQQQFEGKSNIAFTFIDNEKLTIKTDEDYIKTIMLNLTTNAVKAVAATATPLIEWKAYKNNGQVVLSITDNGPGIASDRQKTLFNEATAVNSKTGFGLHIVRDLAQAINCGIKVNSKTGKGTTVSLLMELCIHH